MIWNYSKVQNKCTHSSPAFWFFWKYSNSPNNLFQSHAYCFLNLRSICLLEGCDISHTIRFCLFHIWKMSQKYTISTFTCTYYCIKSETKPNNVKQLKKVVYLKKCHNLKKGLKSKNYVQQKKLTIIFKTQTIPLASCGKSVWNLFKYMLLELLSFNILNTLY